MQQQEILERSSKWVRRLSFVERFMVRAEVWGNMTTCYAIWIDSTTPIYLEHVNKAAEIIHRKMRHLRIVIDEHDNDIWWKELDKENIDVEELENVENVEEIFENLLKMKKYDVKRGPLWFVRFLKRPNRNDFVRDLNNNNESKYEYVCIFGFHHSISDGHTNVVFCNQFVANLSRLLENKPVDLEEIGRFAHPIQDKLALERRNLLYLTKAFFIRVYTLWFLHTSYVKNFIKHYPQQRSEVGLTKVFQQDLNENLTAKFLARCKMEKVTLNSAFAAAANIAMFKLILKHDNKLMKTRFDSEIAVDMRRFWPQEKRSNAYGCHISMIEIDMKTERKDIPDFWEYTRKIHEKIYYELEEKQEVVKHQNIVEKLWMTIFLNNFLSKMKLPSANDYHCCITNMGDISSEFQDHAIVNVSKILRSVSSHFLSTLCQHTFHTFKGKLCYTLNFFPQKMSFHTAKMYSNEIISTIKNVIHMPN